jgi:transcriptional regulator with XRE-family HTH domain
MFTNVKAELKRRNLTLEDLAKVWNCTVSTVSLKLNGHSIITLEEAKLFKDWLELDESIEELFERAN